jgi:hypothetical protein
MRHWWSARELWWQLAQQKSIKIGFVSTFGGPPAVIGNDMRNSFELALDLKS